jgi:site-specific recombinase XerD
MTGPLTRYREGFVAMMMARGYTDLSLANQVRLAADFSRWLEHKAIGLDEIDEVVVAKFLAKRRRSHTHFIARRALAPLLDFLVQHEVIELRLPPRPKRREALVAYEQYLVEERGVSSGRVSICLKVGEEFLASKAPKRISRLTAADVTRFVGRRADLDRLSALRSVLRFLFVSGRCDTNLVDAVPSSPGWRQRSLPQGLEPREVVAVLASCDRRTLVGCRDYAALLLMVRLGLRAGEVAALRLDDVDWQRGEIVIRGKGKFLARLPIPSDVGAAVAQYLKRARPSGQVRAMFLRSRAPFTAMTSSTIVGLAQRAFRTAGISQGGGHRLRHTAATQMLARGATLTEIAQVLRHRHVDTTAIYAKVDRSSLRAVARPWPEDADTPCSLVRRWPGGAP